MRIIGQERETEMGHGDLISYSGNYYILSTSPIFLFNIETTEVTFIKEDELINSVEQYGKLIAKQEELTLGW